MARKTRMPAQPIPVQRPLPPPPPPAASFAQPQTTTLPYMYSAPTPATTTVTTPTLSTEDKLAKWRQMRSLQQQQQQQVPPPRELPRELELPQQPQQQQLAPLPKPTKPVAPNPALAEFPSQPLHASQPAPPLNESPTVVMQQRLQDYGITLNSLQNEVDNMKIIIKAFRSQNEEDRKLLLNHMTFQDFKEMHSDLDEAVTTWIKEAESKIHEALQEVNERTTQLNAETLDVVVSMYDKLGGEATFQIPPRTKLRLCYPQVKNSDGIFMRMVRVNNMAEISYHWVPVVQNDGKQLIGNFSL